MAKRVALTALLPGANEALESSAEEAAYAAPRPTAVPEAVQDDRSAAPTQAAPAKPRAGSGQRLHFSDLTRKEARLRDDQIDALAVHARRLSRAKSGTQERITDNTLIRIAVDLLLQDVEKLHGSTESELRNSVGL